MKLKRIIPLLSLLSCITAVGCGSGEEEKPERTPEQDAMIKQIIEEKVQGTAEEQGQKEIYRAQVRCEDLAHVGYRKDNDNAKYNREVEKCREQTAKRYGITVDSVKYIVSLAITKGWY